MAWHLWYANAGGTAIELTSYYDARIPWEFTEQAEEGSFGQSEFVFSDPDMVLDIDGHRRFWIIEDASEVTNDVIGAGYILDQEISRGEGDNFEPLGRAWRVSIADKNALWHRRVMVGTDNARKAETDVARMAWLLATSEAYNFDDVSTYVASSSGTAMDKNDYRGQYFDQIMDDCAQASGRNWYAFEADQGSGRETIAWYNHDTVTAYTSPLFLSNDPNDWTDDALLDGTSLVWPISEDTKVKRDPTRIYSGVYLRYDQGRKAIYRRNTTTMAAYATRDYVADYPNTRTKANAITRATRLLAKLNEPDIRIETTVQLPKGKAAMLRAGMRVPFRATHVDEFVDFQWCRVLSCTISPLQGGEAYRLRLTLAPVGLGASLGVCSIDSSIAVTEGGTYGPLNGVTTDSRGNLWYTNSNHTYFNDLWSFVNGPRPSTNSWGLGFASYGSSGSADFGGSSVNNSIGFVFVGPGTAVISTVRGSTDIGITVSEYYMGSLLTQESSQSGTAGDTFTVTVGALPGDAVSCYRIIELIIGGPSGGTGAGFAGLTWTPS